ncbi:bestrophin-like domain, partial [Rahnella bonaserana]
NALTLSRESKKSSAPPSSKVKMSYSEVALSQFDRLIQARWRLIEVSHSSMSQPFFAMLTLWLMIIFLSFGLIAPRNALAIFTITLGALSIASAVYVIVDLDSPFTGPIMISSQPMQEALLHLNR